MKKIILIATLSFALIALSGCSFFNTDLMVCEYEPLKEYSQYEIEYKDNDIKNVEVVTNIDYSGASEKEFEAYKKTFEDKADEVSERKGLDANIQIDLRMLTYKVSVDIDKYDVEKDIESIFNYDFKKTDFKDVATLRKAITNQSYVCDDIVKK